MVNKCSVFGCDTNHKPNSKGAVFGLPKEEDLKRRWIVFLHRNNISNLKNIFICEKHFQDKFLNKNEKRTRLIMKIKPYPTILSEGQRNLPLSSQPKISMPRKPPAIRIIQEDQLQTFESLDNVTNLSDVDESLLQILGDGFNFVRYENHVIFYNLSTQESSIPEVTTTIRIDKNLRVNLFHKGSPVPLPPWFRQGRDTKLTRKSILENFPSYVEQQNSNNNLIIDELQRNKFLKCPVYSANMLRYALTLRYTSKPAYQELMKEFKLPSLSLLKKLTSGKLDPISSLKALKEHGSIAEDVILSFDEMYLQKCEEYAGGEIIGTNESGDLYKGVVCFMIIGLKSNIPYVIKTIPEKEISGEWLQDEIFRCLQQLHSNGFQVRGVVCDDHSSNVSAYKKLLAKYSDSPDSLYIKLNERKIYLFFDTVHLMKNIRNNLLSRKRFLFPPFQFNELYDAILVAGGEISWNLFHKVYEKDKRLQANLKAAPKLNASVLHPGNCKQSVPVALAVFHPATSAAIKYYFPEKQDAASFLDLVHTWWTISNSKQKNNTSHRLGNAAVKDDKKPQFLRAFANWIDEWDLMKLRNSEKFTLSAQTSYALRRTLRCHASLIEELLSEDFNFVLTARFQSDALERRYSQYRQMSGGRFLVSLKDVQISEKNLKIKTLLKEGISIKQNFLHDDNTREAEELLSSVESKMDDAKYTMVLSQESREVSDFIAGFIAQKARKITEGCCESLIVSSETPPNGSYLEEISRGGLTVASYSLSECISQAFAMLDACSDLIRKYKVPSCKAGKLILNKFLDDANISCANHHEKVLALVINTVMNIFLNNQRKRTSDTVVKDRIAAFKKCKRDK